MNTIAITKTHVVCPACRSPDSTVDHLKGSEQQLKWYCQQCGAEYTFTLTAGFKVVDVKLTGNSVRKTLVLLRCGKVGLVVQGMSFSHIKNNNDGYYYDEGTCPTNYMPQVLKVIDLETGDPDPHGIFEYVKTLPWDDRIESEDEFPLLLLPHFNQK